MQILIFLVIILSSFLYGAGPTMPRRTFAVNPPAVTDTIRKNKNIVVSIDKDNKMSIGTRPVLPSQLDSVLANEIRNLRADYPNMSVVINCDTAVKLGSVFHIIQVAKRENVKVVANVK